MNAMYETFRDVIKNWPGGPKGFARAVGISAKLAYSWRMRDVIPPGYWLRLIEGGANAGFSAVTLEDLAEMAEQKLPPAG